MKLIKRIVLYFFALNLMAMGVALYLKVDIGVGSWDVLHGNLYDFYHLTVGTWVFIVGIITVIISLVFYFKISNVLAIITNLFFGWIIDFWFIYVFTFNISPLLLKYSLFFLSLIFLGSGIALLIFTKLSPTPPDILMLSFMK